MTYLEIVDWNVTLDAVLKAETEHHRRRSTPKEGA
jgi:hypothetical protein